MKYLLIILCFMSMSLFSEEKSEKKSNGIAAEIFMDGDGLMVMHFCDHYYVIPQVIPIR